MKNQQIILFGIGIWLTGVILDAMLTRYSYILIHLGTIATIFGCLKWARNKENRTRLKETFIIKRNFVEMIKQVFDFSWSRISILWTVCALVGMLIVHLSGLVMGSSRAYEAAINSISINEKVLNKTGEILDFSYMISGNITTSGRSNLNIGVIGYDENLRIKAVIDGTDGNYITKKLIILECKRTLTQPKKHCPAHPPAGSARCVSSCGVASTQICQRTSRRK